MRLSSSLLNILFLGAGKRVSLLEYFQAAANSLKIVLNTFCLEKQLKVPAGTMARILVGPDFKDAGFYDFLLEMVSRYDIDMVIPNMDSATVALSRVKDKISEMGCRAVVSDQSLCVVMEDKLLAERWFVEHEFQIPFGNEFPRIVKNRFGFGSRDQFIIHTEDELKVFFARHNSEDYFIQPFITGQEYSVDAYVDRSGHLLASLSRKRIEVSDGEVNVSEIHHHAGIKELTYQLLSFPGWEGPITLQFIDSTSGPLVLEINPRFGGGVTHSIHCGLDMPRWLIMEHLGLPIEPANCWSEGSIMTRCRRDFFYDIPDRS